MNDTPFIVWWGSVICRLTFDTTINFYLLYNIIHRGKYRKKIKNIIETKSLVSINNNEMIHMSKYINKIFTHQYYNDEDNKMCTLQSQYKPFLLNENLMIFKIQDSNDFTCYIIADKVLNKIIISFRGSRSLLNVETTMSLKTTTNKSGTFQKEIYKILKNKQQLIYSCLRYLLNEFINTPDLIIVGYSLGGGYSTLFSYLFIDEIKKSDILYSFVNNMICITYGSIKIMDGKTRDKMNQMIQKKKLVFIRYITQGDPIPNYPLNDTLYHTGFQNYYCDNHFLDISEKIKNTLTSFVLSKKYKSNIEYKKMNCSVKPTNKNNPLNHMIQCFIDYTTFKNISFQQSIKENDLILTKIYNSKEITDCKKQNIQKSFRIHEKTKINDKDLLF